MTEARDSLVEVPIESWPILCDKFKVDWPQHILGYCLLDNFISRFSKTSKSRESVKVFSLNGEWESDATFIAVMNERTVLFASLAPNGPTLRNALKLLNFTSMIFFMCIRDVYRPSIDTVISDLKLEILVDDGTVMKYLSKNDAKKFNVEIPPKFSLRSLEKENAAKVYSVWPHRAGSSINFIEYLIEHNISVGLFNEAMELVAWCLRLDFGSLAALQVDENHQRKGYGMIVTKAISKKIAEENDVDITTNIIHANFKSLNLFNKLGFKDCDNSHWVGVRKSV